MFENKHARGVHYTRYIMSWLRSGGSIDSVRGNFKRWLKSLELSETEIDDIVEMASNGKLELEMSAEQWIRNNKKATNEEED